jgi:hypothetical protein
MRDKRDPRSPVRQWKSRESPEAGIQVPARFRASLTCGLCRIGTLIFSGRGLYQSSVRLPSQKSSAARRWPPSPSVAGLRPQPHLSGSSGRPQTDGTASPARLPAACKQRGSAPGSAPSNPGLGLQSAGQGALRAGPSWNGQCLLQSWPCGGRGFAPGRQGQRPVERQVIGPGTRCASSEEELTVIAQWHEPVHDSCSQRPAPRTDEVRLPGRRPRP